MIEWIQQWNGVFKEDTLFWFAALAGTALFVIQLLVSGLGSGGGDGDSLEWDAFKFKWLSKQAVTGFLMMFGWAGLSAGKEFHLPLIPTLLVAASAGVVLILITGSLFKGAKKLHSPGSEFRIEDALGKNGLLYQRIEGGGTGKVTVLLNEMTYEIDAQSESGEDIDSFTSVKITQIRDGKTVAVAKCV